MSALLFQKEHDVNILSSHKELSVQDVSVKNKLNLWAKVLQIVYQIYQYKPANQPTNQPANQTSNQPTNQPTNQSTNQPTNQKNQPIN